MKQVYDRLGSLTEEFKADESKALIESIREDMDKYIALMMSKGYDAHSLGSQLRFTADVAQALISSEVRVNMSELNVPVEEAARVIFYKKQLEGIA